MILEMYYETLNESDLFSSVKRQAKIKMRSTDSL